MAEKRKRGDGEGKLVLGYWAIRGLGQPIRLLLEFAKIPYEDKLYHSVLQDDGSCDKSSWFDEKHNLGLPFPNLPYLIDGDLKFTQTNAILQVGPFLPPFSQAAAWHSTLLDSTLLDSLPVAEVSDERG